MNPLTDWIAVVGERTSAHGTWEDAVQHIAAAAGVERIGLWFRPGDLIGMLVFDDRGVDVEKPVGWITDPVQYQRAKSRGDLEHDEFPQPANRFMLHINQMPSNVRSAGQESHLLPGLSLNLQAMKKTQPEPTVYIVLEKAAPHVTIRSKQYPVGTVFEVAPGDKPVQSKVDRLVKYGHVRVATDADRTAAATAILVDKKSASAAAGPKAESAGVQTESVDGTFRLLDPREIAPSPVNPRRHFDDASMQELTDSVREKGVRVAINVRAMPTGCWYVEPGTRSGKPGWFLMDRRRFRPNPGTTGGQVYEHIPDEIFQHFFPTKGEAEAAIPKWEIIAGERRWRSSRYAGCETIRAIVETMDDLEAAELQVIENDQREDLSPLESAAGYQYLLSQPGYSIKKLIQKTGKSKTIIYERLKLLELPKVAQEAVVAGRLPMSTAQLIGGLDDKMKEEAALQICGYRDRFGTNYKKPTTVETFREAESTVTSLKLKAENEAKRNACAAELKKKGFKVLEGADAEKVVNYGSLAHGSGHVAVTEVCPRDPKGRTYEQVLKDQPGVERRAVVVMDHNRTAKGLLIYEREQVNAALKKLGLWDAAGSKVAKEKLEKQRAKEKEQREEEQMHSDLACIITAATSAENKAIRAVLRAALQYMLPSYDDDLVRQVADRRKLSGKGPKYALIKHAAANATMAELVGLVAEICTYRIGPALQYGGHLREGRRVLSDLLGLLPSGKGANDESPDVRTEDETADEEEEVAA